MTIDVLGLGESLTLYKKNNNITIGVNDIAKHYHTNYLVLLDVKTRFTKERSDDILKNRDAKVFSHIKHWGEYFKNFNYIQLGERRGLIDIDSYRYSYSSNSTFTACVLAYKLGAKQINLYGVDMVSHWRLKDKHILDKAKQHFLELRKQLNNKGVNICIASKLSALYPTLPLIG